MKNSISSLRSSKYHIFLSLRYDSEYILGYNTNNDDDDVEEEEGFQFRPTCFALWEGKPTEPPPVVSHLFCLCKVNVPDPFENKLRLTQTDKVNTISSFQSLTYGFDLFRNILYFSAKLFSRTLWTVTSFSINILVNSFTCLKDTVAFCINSSTGLT